MLIVHIFIALTSLIFSGYTAFHPSVQKLRITYALVVGTLGTGTYLIATKPVHMLTTCMEGLVYIGVVTTAIIYSTRKLSRLER